MHKCPICGEEIYILRYRAREEVMAWVTCDFDECEYTNWDSEGIAGATEPRYCCPKCDEVLFNNAEEAKKFLKSGELPEHRIPYFVERKLSH